MCRSQSEVSSSAKLPVLMLMILKRIRARSMVVVEVLWEDHPIQLLFVVDDDSEQAAVCLCLCLMAPTLDFVELSSVPSAFFVMYAVQV
jgi:hypothetical protein